MRAKSFSLSLSLSLSLMHGNYSVEWALIHTVVHVTVEWMSRPRVISRIIKCIDRCLCNVGIFFSQSLPRVDKKCGLMRDPRVFSVNSHSAYKTEKHSFERKYVEQNSPRKFSADDVIENEREAEGWTLRARRRNQRQWRQHVAECMKQTIFFLVTW